MNYWTELSIEYANQSSYLDDLFQVYPPFDIPKTEIKGIALVKGVIRLE